MHLDPYDRSPALERLASRLSKIVDSRASRRVVVDAEVDGYDDRERSRLPRNDSGPSPQWIGEEALVVSSSADARAHTLG